MGVKTGGLHFATYAADTAAAETRSIDAVDRAADDVNREVRYVYRKLTPTWYARMVLPEMCRNLPSDLDWGPWPRAWARLLGIIGSLEGRYE